MGKRGLSILLLLVLGTVGVALWFQVREREPVYQGKGLALWLEDYGTNHWGARHETLDREDEAAIRHFGTNLIPLYLKMISTHASYLKSNLLARISGTRLSRFHMLSASDYDAKLQNLRRCGAYGIIALDTNARTAVPALISLVDDKDRDVRYVAIFTIRCLGPMARDALPAVIKCLTNSDFTVRDEAIMALGAIRDKPEQTIPLLLDVLAKNRDGSNHILTADAIEAIGEYRANATSTVPALIKFLHDPNDNVRSAVISSLAEIRGEPQLTVPALAGQLKYEESRSADNLIVALDALGQFGSAARSAVPAVLPFTNSSIPRVSESATTLIKFINSDAPIAKSGK